MSVQNAGAVIREARLKAGLTQAQLAEGVCSVFSLSRIENGNAGVCPSTFQALMAHAGVATEAYPAFASYTDFDCFYRLKRVHCYLDSWQLTYAFDELKEIETMGWADNKFYYQEWLFLHSKLQFRSGCGSHAQIYNTLLAALHISKSDFDIYNFRSILLSITEIRILTLLAQEALYLGHSAECSAICTQLNSYLANSQLAFIEKDCLLAELSIVFSKYLITIKDFCSAVSEVDICRRKMIENRTDSPLLELTFLTGLCHYYLDDHEKALAFFKTAIYSALSIESCYSTICRNYLNDTLHFVLSIDSLLFPKIPLISYEAKQAVDTADFGDGIYDLFSPDVLTIGGLIQKIRITKKISQSKLCSGICSKSKLSKIENGTLQPDVLLAETLLQRLGISSDVFTFFGDTREAQLYELCMHMIRTPRSNRAMMQSYIEEMSHMITSKDTLYWQYLCFEKALLLPSIPLQLKELESSLSITLPGFDINNISDYSLSWTELTIANALCSVYAEHSPVIGIRYLYKVLEYQRSTNIDILLLKRTFPVTAGVLSAKLYSQKRYPELTNLHYLFSSPVIRSSLYFIGYMNAHFCQMLGAQKKYSYATESFYFAYYGFSITGFPSLAQSTANDMENDFNITLS